MEINPNTNTIQLKNTSSLIKNLFRPGSTVKAFVKKTSGENVIISVSNNTFRVKSMVNLDEGSWIKGKVFLDKNGTVNLKLLETLSPEDQVRLQAEDFVARNSLNQLPGAKKLVEAFLGQNLNPSADMIKNLAPLTKNLSENQIKAILWLLSNNLTANGQNLDGALNYLQLQENFAGNLQGTQGTWLQYDSELANMLTLNLFGSGSEKNSLNFNQIKDIFNIFVSGDGANKFLEEYISLLSKGKSSELELLSLTTLLQKLNIKSSHENLPFFWGVFFLNFAGGQRPVEFLLSRRFIKHDKKSKGKEYSSAYNLGLYLHPPNLGQMVIRFFYTPPVLSLKFNLDNTDTLNFLKSNINFLKKSEGFKKIQLAKIEFEETDIDTVKKARKILNTAYNPFGVLDIKA
ncbi:hypothetical protein [Natranaerofaba carboxydovora]|uniref:hypothetical protein n=1 Tax=Natranaerofaba carboxydovora TaxID=2742683 RepID=UPI001F13D5C9|nr:hypothetical protein [Natranaerofaba carboxydovora]UMZ75078.1 hypothetical protein ACONDI_02690 [Natranaerofaba carboxydovora]